MGDLIMETKERDPKTGRFEKTKMSYNELQKELYATQSKLNRAIVLLDWCKGRLFPWQRKKLANFIYELGDNA